MTSKEYTHLMDAIELLHQENIALAGIVARLHMAPKDSEKFVEEIEGIWQKEFNNVRRNNW